MKAQPKKNQVKHAVLEGLIPSAISDTGATSTAGSPKDIQSFDVTGELSTKVFRLPDGSSKAAREKATLKLPLRDPANQVDVVPGIEQRKNGRSRLHSCIRQ